MSPAPQEGIAAPAAQATSSSQGALADFVALGKPSITLNVFITALGGMWLSPIRLGLGQALLALFGITLVVYGANTLNMYLERDTDALMKRTRTRPLPSGRMAPDVALRAGVAASVVAIGLLTFCINPLTGLLAAISLALYVLAYTPFKRRSTLALLVGAIPGAAPPLLGWTAATGIIEPGGLALFFIMFVWQIPHFLAISIFRRDEYERAGLKIMPNVRGLIATKLRVVLYAAVLGVVSVTPYPMGLATRAYFWVALLLGAGFLVLCLGGLRDLREQRELEDRWARRVFFATLLHLPLLLVALACFRR